MPRSLKIILWVCLGLVGVLALCFALLATFDWNYVRPWINQQASQAADRPVAIQGDLDVDWVRAQNVQGWRGWVPWPQITAKDVTVGNPAGPTEGKSMAQVSSLTVLLNPLALLGKTVEVANLEIEKANVLLERQADGTANWDFNKKEEDKKPSTWKFDLQKISLQSVHAQVVDATSKLDMKADLDTLEEATPEGYGMGWKASGTYNDADISGEGSTGGILSLRQGSEPFPLRGEVKVGSTVIALEGSVTRPQALAALDVRLKLAGDTMADLLPLVGIALPDTPPYSTEGHLIGTLEGENDRWRYEDFKGKVGESDIQGTLEYQVRKPRPLLTGVVESKQLRLKDLGPLIGAQTSDVKGKGDKKKEDKQPANKALPVSPINTKAWGVMDADVQFKGLRILREKALPLDHIEAHVKLDDKVLTLTPLNFGVAGGNLRNTITLNGRSEKIEAELKTAARHLKMKQLFPGAESMNASFGEVHGDAELTGRGNSIAELLGHSNGEVKALVSRGTISHFLLEAAGLNVANMVMVKVFGDEQIVLNCLAADFGVKNGLMNARAFRLETDDTIVDITGTINLDTERMDLDIRPANKTVRIFTLRSPLYAKGTFKDPDVGVQAGPLMARAGAAVALGVIATPFAALLPLLNVGTDESAGCASLEARAQADPKAPPPGKGSSGEPAASGKQAAPDSKAPASAGQQKAKDGKKPSAEERENWPSQQPKP
ncbi:AsmA family protein [Parapusillimonas sp. SGNA-6]|nr:AsmA family protein [Parapusillimonas sp. SGNA-6]